MASDAGSSRGGTRFMQVKATRVIATVMGVVFAVGGMNHGLFEALQGTKPTNGSYIEAIGEAQRFWPLGNEPACTIVPNFLWTGILAMLVGLAIIVWEIWFLPRRHGPTVLRGIMGFGAHTTMIHTFKIERLSEDLPIVIEVVDAKDKIEGFLSFAETRVQRGILAMVETVKVRVYRGGQPGA